MTIYVEYVIINNMLANLLIVYLTAILLGRRFRRANVLLTAFVGTLLAFPLLYVTEYVFLYKLAVAFMLPLILQKYRSLKEYLLVETIFLLATFAYGGAVYAIGLFANIPVYEGCILGFISFAGLLLLYAARQLNLKKNNDKISSAEVTAIVGGKKYTAIWDSGNSLTDPLTLEPLVVVNRRVFDNSSAVSKGSVNVKTASGESKLPTFVLEHLDVSDEKGNRRYENVKAAVSDRLEEVDILLNLGIEWR